MLLASSGCLGPVTYFTKGHNAIANEGEPYGIVALGEKGETRASIGVDRIDGERVWSGDVLAGPDTFWLMPKSELKVLPGRHDFDLTYHEWVSGGSISSTRNITVHISIQTGMKYFISGWPPLLERTEPISSYTNFGGTNPTPSKGPLVSRPATEDGMRQVLRGYKVAVTKFKQCNDDATAGGWKVRLGGMKMAWSGNAVAVSKVTISMSLGIGNRIVCDLEFEGDNPQETGKGGKPNFDEFLLKAISFRP